MPNKNTISSITIIGAGNVGWHLATLFQRSGVIIHKIISRKAHKARELADSVHAEWSDNFGIDLPANTLMVLTVNDTALPEVLARLKQPVNFLVHTSGSIPIDILRNYAQNYGVFYPFQTFTRSIELITNQFPICIEASAESFRKSLFDFACKLTEQIYQLNSEKRKKLHLAGITINNFTNHLLALANNYLTDNNIDTSILLPLLNETIEKVKKCRAEDIQTGPARRANRKIINEHLQMLNNNLALQKIYKVISESIMEYYHII